MFQPKRHESGPSRGRFMKKPKCMKCEKIKEKQEQGKIYTPQTYEWTGHRIVDMNMLADGLWCRFCDDMLSLRHCIEEKRKGFASMLRVKCPRCGVVRNVHTAPQQSSQTKGYTGLTPETRQMTLLRKPSPLDEHYNEFITRKGTFYGRDSNKEPIADSATPKAKRGRPRKITLETESQTVSAGASTSHADERDGNGGEGEEKGWGDDDDPNENFGGEEDPDWEIETDFWEKKKMVETVSCEVYCCEYCAEKYNSKRRVIQHMKEVHPEFNKFVCGWCQRTCVSESAFRSHRRSHRAEAGCMCETCGKKCRNERHLEQHKLDHLPDEMARKYSCTYCGKRYKTEAYVNKHEKLHTTEKSFICDQCPKKFISKQRLEEHMQLHTGEFKFVCEICLARFTRKDNMTAHIKQNHRYVCPICNFTFTTAEEVKVHRNDTHTREEITESESDGHAPYYKYTDFQCNYCHRFLASKQSLNFHIATHTGEGRKRPTSTRIKDKPATKVQKVVPGSFQESYEANVPEPEIQIHEEEPVQNHDTSNGHVNREETLLATYNLIRIVIDQ